MFLFANLFTQLANLSSKKSLRIKRAKLIKLSVLLFISKLENPYWPNQVLPTF